MPRGVRKEKPTQAEFIRSQPPSMSAEDVVRAGKKAGLAIRIANVHTTRYYLREKAKKNGDAKPVKVVKGNKEKSRQAVPKIHGDDEDLDLLASALAGFMRATIRRELRTIVAAGVG